MITTIIIFILILILMCSMRYGLLHQINQLPPYYRGKFIYLNINDINSLKYNELLALFITILNIYLLIFKIVSTNILYNPCFYILCVNIIYSLRTVSKLIDELEYYK